MICLSEFIRRFKETLPGNIYQKTPRHAYFIIEFLRITSRGEREWYSPLLVVNFLPEDALQFYYVKTAEFDPEYYNSATVAEFKYLDNWVVLEVSRSTTTNKTIVRIRPR